MIFLFSSVSSKAIDMCLFAAIVSFKIYSYSIYQLVTGRLLGWKTRNISQKNSKSLRLKKEIQERENFAQFYHRVGIRIHQVRKALRLGNFFCKPVRQAVRSIISTGKKLKIKLQIINT